VNDVLNNLVLRALYCEVCGQLLPVACDDADTVLKLRVVHDTSHHVFLHEDEVAVWYINEKGQPSVPINNSIIRLGGCHGAILGYKVNTLINRNDKAPYSIGTADEFMASYAWDSGVSVELLKEHGRIPRYVSRCGDYDFPHWEMGFEGDDDFDRRNEIEPPK